MSDTAPAEPSSRKGVEKKSGRPGSGLAAEQQIDDPQDQHQQPTAAAVGRAVSIPFTSKARSRPGGALPAIKIRRSANNGAAP